MLAACVMAGPLPTGLSAPAIVSVEHVLRRPRAGEASQAVACPVCGGSGTWTGWFRGVRTAAPCRRCRGAGVVEALVLVRLISSSQDELNRFTAWASAHRLRFDRGLALGEEGGAGDEGDEGSALVWCGLDGLPLPFRGSHLAAHRALGVAVEANGHIEGHVALHALGGNGDIQIAGIWDVADDGDGLELKWSASASRRIARSMRIQPPVAAIAAALDRARCRRCPHHAPHYAAVPIRPAGHSGRPADKPTATVS